MVKIPLFVVLLGLGIQMSQLEASRLIFKCCSLRYAVPLQFPGCQSGYGGGANLEGHWAPSNSLQELPDPAGATTTNYGAVTGAPTSCRVTPTYIAQATQTLNPKP
eukprot:9474975-Pyramimonas_sp.AAC.1